MLASTLVLYTSNSHIRNLTLMWSIFLVLVMEKLTTFGWWYCDFGSNGILNSDAYIGRGDAIWWRDGIRLDVGLRNLYILYTQRWGHSQGTLHQVIRGNIEKNKYGKYEGRGWNICYADDREWICCICRIKYTEYRSLSDMDSMMIDRTIWTERRWSF